MATSTIRIVCISDTHGLHEQVRVPDGDLLIHAGDCTRMGGVDQLDHFNDWLAGLPHAHKIVIAGNCDYVFEREREVARARIAAAVYLEDEAVRIDGLALYGSPWQPVFHDMSFNLPRGAALKEKWDRIPIDTDVLITHTPPRGVGDVTRRGEAVGCDDLLEAWGRVRPGLHVFGHIHEAYGTYQRDGLVLVNASFLGPGGTTNPAIVIDLPATGGG